MRRRRAREHLHLHRALVDKGEETIWDEVDDNRESRRMRSRGQATGFLIACVCGHTGVARFWGFVSDVSENIEDLHSRLEEASRGRFRPFSS